MSYSEKLMILADQEKTVTATIDKIPFTKLVKSNWSINVTVAADNEASIKVPRGILHLHAKNPNTNESEVNVLDFTKEELVKFYEVIEQIQEKLDEMYIKADK